MKQYNRKCSTNFSRIYLCFGFYLSVYGLAIKFHNSVPRKTILIIFGTQMHLSIRYMISKISEEYRFLFENDTIYNTKYFEKFLEIINIVCPHTILCYQKNVKRVFMGERFSMNCLHTIPILHPLHILFNLEFLSGIRILIDKELTVTLKI